MLERPLPRYVVTRPLASGATGFYWVLPGYFRKLGCDMANEPLGTDYVVACGEDGRGGRACVLNETFDAWNGARKGDPSTVLGPSRFGTVDWLFREYKRSAAYAERVSPRSRADYDYVMQLVAELPTKAGDTVGDRQIKAITPRSADKIYASIVAGGRGERFRQGEKAIAICKRAWAVVHRLHPDLFDRATPNPWVGVTVKRRTVAAKKAVSRDDVYTFAWGAIDAGEPEVAAAAVICFEWLQRPENVLAGYIRWPDYRGPAAPNAVRIEHHKTGATILHPLGEPSAEPGAPPTLFYAEAEAVLAKLPRRGVPMILRLRRDGHAEPYTIFQMGHIIRRLRAELGLPDHFTLDACRHGGMTELEEAGLTDGQGRALSAHKSQAAYERYAKRTFERALGATRKRHAHRLANA